MDKTADLLLGGLLVLLGIGLLVNAATAPLELDDDDVGLSLLERDLRRIEERKRREAHPA